MHRKSFEQFYLQLAGVAWQGLPSVMTGFSISVQPTAPASRIGRLSEQ